MKHLAASAILALAFLFLNSCKKEKQSSVWQINDDKFETNKVSFEITKAGNFLTCYESDGFSFRTRGFGNPLPPQLGTSMLLSDTSSNIPYSISADFHHNGAYYLLLPGHSDTLIISMQNGKYRYEMRPGWYYNYYNPNDTVLISGTFNEP